MWSIWDPPKKVNLLMKSIQAGVVDNVLKIIECADSPDDINQKNCDKENALHFLCSSAFSPTDQIRIALAFLATGADMKANNGSGQSPLVVAEKSSNASIVDLLSNILPQTSTAETRRELICERAKAKNSSSIRSLIMQGVNCNVRSSSFGYSPLIASVYNNDFATASALLCDQWLLPLFRGNMASPNYPGRFNMTPLHYCAQEGYGEMMALLLRCGGDRYAKDDSGRTPLDIAAAKFEEYSEGGVEKSNDQGRNYNLTGTLLANDPVTCSICCAAGLGTLLDINSLLMQGVDINSVHLVESGGFADWRIERWKPLEEGGKDFESVRHELGGCLIAAAAYNRPDVLEYLLEVPGVDINIRNGKGQTALMYAGGVGTDLVLKLLKAGARRDLGDLKGRTALDWARSKGMQDAADIIRCVPSTYMMVQAASAGDLGGIKALLAQGVDINEVWGGSTALIAGCKIDDEQVVAAILDVDGVDLEAKDGNGESALFHACRLGFEAVVLQLLRAGCVRDRAASDVAANNGHVLCAICVLNDPTTSYIHDACRRGKHLVLRALLMQGADPNAVDDRAGRNASTALMVACEFSTEVGGDHQMVLKILFATALRVNMKNAGGTTALMLSAGVGNLNLCKTLLKMGAKRDAKDQRGWTAANYAKNGVGGNGWGGKRGGGKDRAGLGNYLKFCII